MSGGCRIREAVAADVPLLFELIRELATYERLLPEVTTTEQLLTQNLFGSRPYAEAAIAEDAEGEGEGDTAMPVVKQGDTLRIAPHDPAHEGVIILDHGFHRHHRSLSFAATSAPSAAITSVVAGTTWRS